MKTASDSHHAKHAATPLCGEVTAKQQLQSISSQAQSAAHRIAQLTTLHESDLTAQPVRKESIQQPADLAASPQFVELVRAAFLVAAEQLGQHMFVGTAAATTSPPSQSDRWQSPRQRAAAFQKRMLEFGAIYNAGCMVRHAMHGSPERRAECAERFCQVLVEQIAIAQDKEALIYAIADTLKCGAHGVPWEA